MTKHMRIHMEGMDRGIAAKRFMTDLLSRKNQFRLTNWVNGIVVDIALPVKRKLKIGKGKIGKAGRIFEKGVRRSAERAEAGFGEENREDAEGGDGQNTRGWRENRA